MSEIITKHQLNLSGQEIRSDLTFDPAYGLGEHPDLGNCYEFAVRMHQAIKDDVGSANYVAYAADHAVNIGSNSVGQLYVASSDVEGLTAHEAESPELSDILPRENIGKLRSGTIDGSLATSLGMHVLSNTLSWDTIEKIRLQRPWFADHWLKTMRPNATIMGVAYAREALPNYHEFRRGIHYRDFERTRDSLEALRVRTPQHETRPRYNQELPDFQRMIRYMARNTIASSYDLGRLVDSYSEILPEVNTAANVVFGDCYRDIAKQMDNDQAHTRAKQFYDRAGHHSRTRKAKDLVRSKSSKLDSLSIKV